MSEQDPDADGGEEGSETGAAIGPTNYAASAAEAGSAYSDRGPTLGDVTGEPVSDDAASVDADQESDQGPSIGDVYRGGG